MQKPTSHCNRGGQFGAGMHLFKNQRKRNRHRQDSQKLGILLHRDLGHIGGSSAPGAKARSVGGTDLHTEAGEGTGTLGEEAPPTDPGPHSKLKVK